MTQLGCSLRDDEYLGLCKGETLVRTQKIAVACMDALTEIERIIKGYFQNNNISVVDRLKRYSMEKKVNLIRANLDHLKSTVILMLEVIKYARGIVKCAFYDLCASASINKDSGISKVLRRETV